MQSSKRAAETAKKTVHIAKNVIAKAKVVIEKAVQIAISLGKKAILLLKSLGALIVAGGTVSVVIIVLICLIGFLLASPFGLFFADETPVNNETLTWESVKTSLTTEVDEKINQIKEIGGYLVATEQEKQSVVQLKQFGYHLVYIHLKLIKKKLTVGLSVYLIVFKRKLPKQKY